MPLAYRHTIGRREGSGQPLSFSTFVFTSLPSSTSSPTRFPSSPCKMTTRLPEPDGCQMSAVRRSTRRMGAAQRTVDKCDNEADNQRSWDDWVPQDRLRKLTDENKELASNLKKEMEAQRRAAKPPMSTVASGKKRAFGSDLAGSSARGSEERSSVPLSRGIKRTRDGKELEGIERVRYANAIHHRFLDLTMSTGRRLSQKTSDQAPNARYSEIIARG